MKKQTMHQKKQKLLPLLNLLVRTLTNQRNQGLRKEGYLDIQLVNNDCITDYCFQEAKQNEDNERARRIEEEKSKISNLGAVEYSAIEEKVKALGLKIKTVWEIIQNHNLKLSIFRFQQMVTVYTMHWPFNLSRKIKELIPLVI